MSFAPILDRMMDGLNRFREWTGDEPDPSKRAFRLGPEDMAEFDAAVAEASTHPNPSGERSFMGIRVLLIPDRRAGFISLDTVEEKREPLIKM